MGDSDLSMVDPSILLAPKFIRDLVVVDVGC